MNVRKIVDIVVYTIAASAILFGSIWILKVNLNLIYCFFEWLGFRMW